MFCFWGSLLYSVKIKSDKIFLAVYFVNANLSEKRVWVLLSGKELGKLLEDSQNIFKKSYIDRYVQIQSVTFCNEKYSVFNDFYHTKSLEYNALENKSSETCEYQTDELDDDLINHKEYSYPEKN